MKKEGNEQFKTTGHEWDGIKEYNRPEPFWLRVLFYLALFFALFYWILYPSWPTPKNFGILGWNSYNELFLSQKEIELIRSKYQAEFNKLSFAEIITDPSLLKFAIAGGQSAFQNDCAVCHGTGGSGGGKGYPDLTSGAWLWGDGSIDEIYKTIKYGIRSDHPETRDSAQMSAFGKDKILSTEQIDSVVKYVLSFNLDNSQSFGEGYDVFQQNCATCHGADAKGNSEFGVPNLRDHNWLYGGLYDDIYNVVFYGRSGVMPYWEGKLSDSTIRQLAIYVYQISRN